MVDEFAWMMMKQFMLLGGWFVDGFR